MTSIEQDLLYEELDILRQVYAHIIDVPMLPAELVAWLDEYQRYCEDNSIVFEYDEDE